MAVHLHSMLDGNFDQFLFAGSGYCNCAIALRREFPTVDVFPSHGCLPKLGDDKIKEYAGATGVQLPLGPHRLRIRVNGGAVEHDAPKLPLTIGSPFNNPKVLQIHVFNRAP